MLFKIHLALDTKITVIAAQCEAQLLILNTQCRGREAKKIVRSPHLAKREREVEPAGKGRLDEKSQWLKWDVSFFEQGCYVYVRDACCCGALLRVQRMDGSNREV